MGDKRENVAVMLSYDEGKSWSLGRVIVPSSAAYSSLCILPDGTIGMYVEEDPNGGDTYEMVFYNFTLEWLEGK
jgi:sialidase-1